MVGQKCRKRYDRYVVVVPAPPRHNKSTNVFLFFFFSTANEPDELCASMYSFHSSPEEKNKILFALAQHGIETTVDRVAKKKRIRDWIQESVIQEEDDEEEEAEEDTDQMSSPPAMSSRKPIAGHVSTVRAQERAARKQIKTTLKDASNKHINPRTGEIQHGPSEMGPNADQETNIAAATDERIQNGNENGPIAMPRNAILVDVSSQTSNESQKQFGAHNSQSQTPERTNSIEMPMILTTHSPSTPTHTQQTQTNLTRRNSTSHGLLSAFHSLASISVPESQQMPTHVMQTKPEAQPRQAYLQRHNTTVLTKHQPITASRSANNSINNLINDSGYGSLDKLRSMDGNTVLSSPLLSKRSVVQSTISNINSNYPNGGTNTRNNLNGLSHQHSGSTSSPFHSDSGGDGSPRGSNGFVNFVGVTASTPMITASMKDTAYDRVKSSNRRTKK